MESTLIVDCGRHSTKYSFISKKHKFSSEVLLESSPVQQCTATPVTDEDWLRCLSSLLDSTLEVGEDLSLLLLLHTQLPRRSKEALLLAAFERYGAQKVCLEYVAPAALFSCGETSGVVMDVGYTGVRLTPVLKGVPVVDMSSSATDIGAFYAETELLFHLNNDSSSSSMQWNLHMAHVMPLLDAECDFLGPNDKKEVILPDGSRLQVPLTPETMTKAGERLLYSATTNILDSAWHTLLHTTDMESSSHYLRIGGASEAHLVSSRLSLSLSRSFASSPPTEVLSKNVVKAPVMGGCILSQLSCYKSMCVTVADYNDEGPHGCVRQFATDSR